jgi:hypothetical protein
MKRAQHRSSIGMFYAFHMWALPQPTRSFGSILVLGILLLFPAMASATSSVALLLTSTVLSQMCPPHLPMLFPVAESEYRAADPNGEESFYAINGSTVPGQGTASWLRVNSSLYLYVDSASEEIKCVRELEPKHAVCTVRRS